MGKTKKSKKVKPVKIDDTDSDDSADELLASVGIQDEALIALLKSLPYKEMVLSIVFAYAWKRAYSPPGGTWKMTDVILGIFYGFTIPDALAGGVVANGYAVAALGALGAGLIPGSENWEEDLRIALSDAKDSLSSSGLGFALAGPAGAAALAILSAAGIDLPDLPQFIE